MSEQIETRGQVLKRIFLQAAAVAVLTGVLAGSYGYLHGGHSLRGLLSGLDWGSFGLLIFGGILAWGGTLGRSNDFQQQMRGQHWDSPLEALPPTPLPWMLLLTLALASALVALVRVAAHYLANAN